MKGLKKEVESILQAVPMARDDNFILFYLVCKLLPNVPNDIGARDFAEVALNHSQLGLPSFEAVTRARRRIVREHSELAPSKAVKEIRKEEEEAYLEAYGRGKGCAS